MIVYQCPGCGVAHKSGPALAGLRIRCPRCGAEVTIPRPDAAPVPPHAATKADPAAAPRPAAAKAPPPAKSGSADRAPGKKRARLHEDDGREDGAPEADRPPRKKFPRVTAGVVGAAAVVFGLTGLWFLTRGGGAPQVPKPGPLAKNGDSPPAVAPPAKGDKDRAAERNRKDPEKKDGEKKGPEPKGPAEKTPAVEVKAPPPEALKVRAAELLAEYRAAPADTDRKYAGKLLEVRGSFARLAAGDGGAAGPFVQLSEAEKGDGPHVTVALDPSVPRELWKGVRPGQAVTLRGSYWKGLALARGEAVKLQAPGDDLYRGKEVELEGNVERLVHAAYHASGFPALLLEPDAADSAVRVECLFKKADEKALEALPPGRAVLVRGTCAGRLRDLVRLDNCVLAEAKGPPPGAVRVTVARFTRDYEADVRDDAAGAGPPVAVAAEQLVKEYEADPEAAAKKYRGQALEVGGAVEAIDPTARSLTYEGNTDQRLRVVCRFTPSRFRKLVREPYLTVRGVCRGLWGASVRLEACAMVEDLTTERLGAAYYPTEEGRTLTYDLARVAGAGERPVARQVMTFRDKGLIEVATVRKGVLRGKSLFAGADAVKWGKEVGAAPAATVRCRITGGFIELGLPNPAPASAGALVWEPILKGGARAGDAWTWGGPLGQKATYTLEKFTEHRGRKAAVVKKSLEVKGRPAVAESVHVYVKGVGEVERRTYEVMAKMNYRVLVDEMRLAE